MALVQQALLYGSHFASLLLSYMAVRCLTRQGAWRAPNDYSSILNRLRYGVRLTLLGALRAEWVLLRDSSPRPSAAAAIHSTDLLCGVCQQWLCRDSTPPSVSSTMSRIFLYVKLVARHSLPQGQIVWDRAMELVCFRHIKLQLTQWRNFVNALFTRCSRSLHDELLFALPGVERFPHASQLRENWFDTRPGKNFCNNASNNALLAPWYNSLLAHVDTHPATSALTKDRGTRSGALQWDAYGVCHYLGRVMALLRKLMVLIHMTSGLPARGPELLAVRWCNTELLHNIFICQGYVMLLMAYHKLEWRMGAHAVALFLPSAVVVKFFVLVLPFARILR
jgi:hypothetical protein